MSPKIKSLLYFVCFVAAALLQYALEEEAISTEYAEKTELVKTEAHQISSTDLLFEDDTQ